MRNIPAAWLAVALLAMAAVATAPNEALGQGAVAFDPQVGVIPDGVALSVTPAVSADRRYVRLSLGVGFQTIDGFSNFPVPAAVAGGGANGGGLGGLGGLLGGGAGGNAGGGGGAVGVVSGMNGPIDPGMASTSNTAAGPGYGYGYGYGNGYGFNGPTGYDPFLAQMATTRPAAPARRAKATRPKAAATKKAAARPAQAARAPTATAKAGKPSGG